MSEYNIIKVLKGLKGIQLRPGMYVGDISTSEAALNCVWEVISNSFDEHISGFGKDIKVFQHEGFWSIRDYGRGIPNDWNESEGKLDLELAFTLIHSGGKFDSDNYQFSSGLHGVGITAVNALSSFLICVSARAHRTVIITFVNGELKSLKYHSFPVKRTGTWVIFKCNPKYLPVSEVEIPLLKRKLEFLSYTSSGLRTSYQDIDSVTHFFSEKGIESLMDKIIKGIRPVQEEGAFHLQTETDYGRVEVFFNWYFTASEHLIGITNGLEQNLGGTHINQFVSELKTVLSKYEEGLTVNDIKEGLYGVINISISDPQYSSQTKEKLTAPQGRTIIKSLFNENLPYILKKGSNLQKIASHLKTMSKKKEDYIQSKLVALPEYTGSNILPGKLLDCISKNLEVNEILLTEGDSAAATAKMARDKFFQAVLPIKGKIINVQRSKLKKVINFEAVKHIVASVGTGIGKNFDYKKLRYGKIILMSDADADGFQIKALITALFFKHMRGVIEGGHLFVANPPLFKLSQNLKEKFFLDRRSLEQFLWSKEGYLADDLNLFYSLTSLRRKDTDLELLDHIVREGVEGWNEPLSTVLQTGNLIFKIGYPSSIRIVIFRSPELDIAKRLFSTISLSKIRSTLNLNSKSLKRFKGLGQMNYDELWDLVMNPEKREIDMVTVEDAVLAEREFDKVMGDIPYWRKLLVDDPSLGVHDLDL